MNIKILLVLTCLYTSISTIHSGIKEPSGQNFNFPDLKYFTQSSNRTKTLSYRSVTIVEYVTDPVILYTTLWGIIGLSSALWEPTPSLISGDNPGDMFFQRMKLEPFAVDREYSLTKLLEDGDGNIKYDSLGNPIMVPNGSIYAKNIIEPFFFTEMALYLRSKNYHPLLVVLELFALSFIYEFTVRPFFMNANVEQLIKNPVVGILFGVLLDEISTFLLTTPYLGLHVLAYILNPFNLLPTHRVRSLLIFKPYSDSVKIEAIIKL